MTSKTLIAGIGIVSAVLASTGCNGGSGSYVPKPVQSVTSVAAREGIDQNYIPMAEGKQWTYTAETMKQTEVRQSHLPETEVIYKISKVENIPEGQQVTWEIKVGDKPTDKQIWIVNKDGIYQSVVGLKQRKFTTPQPIVLFPINEHQTFEWRGSGLLPDGTLGSNLVKSHLDGIQEVDTEMGRVKALSISSDLDFATTSGRGKGTSVVWLSPGVGIVRFKQVISQGNVMLSETLRLKSHS